MLGGWIYLGNFLHFLVKSYGGPRSLDLEVESKLQHFWVRRSHKLQRCLVEDEVVLNALDLHCLRRIDLLIHGICDFPWVAAHPTSVIYIKLLIGVHRIQLLVGVVLLLKLPKLRNALVVFLRVLTAHSLLILR